jgi:ferritin-like metal-binding protein YciE
MMKNSLYQIFIELLHDLFDCEKQLIHILPKMIQFTLHPELKIALTNHFNETQNQSKKLKIILESLNENFSEISCKPIQEIVQSIDETLNQHSIPSSLTDVRLIINSQRIAHYAAATYRSARSLARHLTSSNPLPRLDFDEIADILQFSLEEKIQTDETLTDLAEGGFFSLGIHDDAETESKS